MIYLESSGSLPLQEDETYKSEDHGDANDDEGIVPYADPGSVPDEGLIIIDNRKASGGVVVVGVSEDGVVGKLVDDEGIEKIAQGVDVLEPAEERGDAVDGGVEAGDEHGDEHEHEQEGGDQLDGADPGCQDESLGLADEVGKEDDDDGGDVAVKFRVEVCRPVDDGGEEEGGDDVEQHLGEGLAGSVGAEAVHALAALLGDDGDLGDQGVDLSEHGEDVPLEEDEEHEALAIKDGGEGVVSLPPDDGPDDGNDQEDEDVPDGDFGVLAECADAQ